MYIVVGIMLFISIFFVMNYLALVSGIEIILESLEAS